MKKVILLALFMPCLAYGQIIDNFESGSLTNWYSTNPERWKADAVSSISGGFSLHHVYDNPATGSDRIGRELRNYHPDFGTTEWSFLLRYGYDPSSSNNWVVFLVSDASPDQASLSAGTNGYAIGVNISGSDDSLRLVKVKNGVLKTVVSTAINWQTQVGMTQPARITVKRTQDGRWTVSVSKAGVLFPEKSGIDPELFSASWFTIMYRYTSTADRLLWVDDVSITGPFFEDTTPPGISVCSVTGKNSVRIIMNEAPDDAFGSAENFTLNSQANGIKKVEKKTSTEYMLTFTSLLMNNQVNTLEINRVCDKLGNCSEKVRVQFTPSWPEPGNIVITEIMADPLPVVSLPAKEYIEITNTTQSSFLIEKWLLKTGEAEYPLPDFKIESGQIVILCASSDSTLFKKYGLTIGMRQFPVLNDAGKILALSDSTGTLISGVEYSSEWYGETLKKDGGWSLEMIDSSFPFYDQGNWRASRNPAGGTPGKVNSITASNPDRLFTGLINVFAPDSMTVMLKFSESVPGFGLMKDSISLGDSRLQNLIQSDILGCEYVLIPGKKLERNRIYSFEVPSGVKDFAENDPSVKILSFGLAEKAFPGDIKFNELLFNPFPGDPDYIELHNTSDRILDASRLQLVSVNDATGDTSALYPVSPVGRCILPGRYYAVTTDKKSILIRYPFSRQENIFEVAGLPSMADDKGHLTLYNRELEKIDEVAYTEEMHQPAISDYEGISLEKANPKLESMIALNWHSCAVISGGGTPGAPNTDVPVNEDQTAPFIASFRIAGKNSLNLVLSETPDDTFINTANFSLTSGTNIVNKVEKKSPLEYIIIFNNVLVNKKLDTLKINTLCDLCGNCSEKIRLQFTPCRPDPGNIVVTEIMADPFPAVSLPVKEYLELTNTSPYSFMMGSCILKTTDQEYLLPDFRLEPNQIVILCASSDTILFKNYGRTIGLKQFPVLNDAGKILALTDSTGTLISGVEYSSEWYGESLKKDGGWSLEMIDAAYPFYDLGNWKASVSKTGGTPGLKNSVMKENPDDSFTGIQNVFPVDRKTVRVRFTESVPIDSELIKMITIDGVKAEKLIPSDILNREFLLIAGTGLESGKKYSLKVDHGLKDFAGNKALKNEFEFALAEPETKGDILFNELLFNPLPGDYDYIELYNNSSKTLDASRLQLVSVNDEAADTSQLYSISDEQRCILPGDYYVATTDRTRLIDRYPVSDPDRIFEISELPSMSDDKGHLILFNRELEIIDEVIYSEKMHYSLLSGFEGVSLEKINVASESGTDRNWHSAAESSYWGTPGMPNSVIRETTESPEIVSFSSSKITPDNDGYEDFLTIETKLPGAGSVISITIFDEAGNLVRRLASNLLAAPESSFTWDGTDADGNAVRNGIYVFLITAYDETGKTSKWKKVCTVIRK